MARDPMLDPRPGDTFYSARLCGGAWIRVTRRQYDPKHRRERMAVYITRVDGGRVELRGRGNYNPTSFVKSLAIDRFAYTKAPPTGDTR